MSNICNVICASLLLLGYHGGKFANCQLGYGWKDKLLTQRFAKVQDQLVSVTSPVVAIGDGFLRGFVGETIGKRKIASFRNIPYGKPPVGPLRFQAPVTSVPWDGVRDATGESVHCIQVDFMTRQRNIRGREDCLYLEVHTPLATLNEGWGSYQLPVMVWLHGGSFASGAGGLYGPHYLLDENVVLVTVNYRLGPFGFLSTGDRAAYGNAGMKDQVLALKWIQENIVHFGGDPDSVTIFGQSAGAGAVQHHIVSPMSRGLFHRGISQSGSSLCWWAIQENAKQVASRMGQLFGCGGSSQEMVKCLQGLPAERLVTAQLNLTEWRDFPIVVFGPVVEPKHPAAFLSEHPEDIYRSGGAARVPWITGFAKWEMGWLFSDFIQDSKAVAELNKEWERLGPVFLTVKSNVDGDSRVASRIRDFYLGKNNTEIGYRNRYQVSQMLGDRFFLKCGLDGLYLHSKYTGEPVYAYEFSFEGKYSIVQLYGQNATDWGVAHLDDVAYLLNNTEHFSKIKRETDKEEYKMVEIITSTWANFATYGSPYVGHVSEETSPSSIWRPALLSSNTAKEDSETSAQSLQFLSLDLNPKMVSNPYLARYKFWNDLNLVDS